MWLSQGLYPGCETSQAVRVGGQRLVRLHRRKDILIEQLLKGDEVGVVGEGQIGGEDHHQVFSRIDKDVLPGAAQGGVPFPLWIDPPQITIFFLVASIGMADRRGSHPIGRHDRLAIPLPLVEE